jgi:diacylglycerol kinase (ATP)
VRSLIVVNPVAGKGKGARVWRSLSEMAASDCVMTERPGHARDLARTAAVQGIERVVAVGGDGTISEVAHGLAGSNTALAIIPAGTGNDCARNLGIPADPPAAARLALSGVQRAIDLGEIQISSGRTYFVNVAGFGFDAEVTARVERLPAWVSVGNTLPYVLGVLQALWNYQAPRIAITVDNRTIDRRCFVVAVANGPSYGGGMYVAPEARPDDGVFDVCVIGDVSRAEVLRLVPKMYSGGHRTHPAVEFIRCTELHATSAANVHCQADGELVGGLPVTFKIHAGGLQCVTGLRR